MKGLILYYSKTGFTKRYATWLQEDLGWDCLPFEERAQVELSQYDGVVFGSSLRAGSIRKLSWLKKQLPRLSGKRVAVFFTGAMGPDEKAIAQCVEKNFTREELSQVQPFYLWGGMNYESMAGLDKWMMSVFRKMLASKKNPTQEDKLAAQMVAASFDKADRKYLAPLEEYLTR